MSGRRNRKRKVRVPMRKNRARPRRAGDLTRRLRTDEDTLLDVRTRESVRAKGDLSRMRTLIVDDEQAPAVDESLWKRGVVTTLHGLICGVDDEEGRHWECVVRRLLRTLLIEQRTPVAVGDRVRFSDQSEHHAGRAVGVIERVEPRRSQLVRRDRRGRGHTIVANAEQLLIVTSVARPRLKPHLIDRYLVAAGRGNLRPIIVFNKWDLLEAHPEPAATTPGAGAPPQETEAAAPDLDDALAVDLGDETYAGPPLTVEDVVAEFAALGYTCLRTSAVEGEGLDDLRAVLRDRTTVLAGQSGVGKSSLLNALQPGLNLQVRPVSEETEKGRHTTSLARMLRLDMGGYVVDTPGIRAFDLWAVEPGELEAYFVEFVPRIRHCRFKDCHHTQREPDCAIRAAVEAGEISARRYFSYLKMLEELAGERRRAPQ